jgi:hypothetical protein
MSIQTGAKVYDYARLRQCHRAFAVILHKKATSVSPRIYFLGPFKENKSTRKKAKSENVIFYFFFFLDSLKAFFGMERLKYWMVNCVKMTNSASEWTLDDQNIVHFTIFKKKSDNNLFFLTIYIQMCAKVYDYAQLRQCYRAYVIDQTFAVILHREATSASPRIYFLEQFKEKKSTRKKAKYENVPVVPDW